jgi:transposase InsO family protein
MKFAFIAREKARFPIDLLCAVVGVSRAGFYAAQHRPVSGRRSKDQQLAVHVAAAHAASHRRYGSPRVYRELQAQGHDIGRHRVARLMREQGLRARAKRRFQRTTDSQHGLPAAANVLDRQFTVPAPNGLGVRHHVPLDARGLAVPRCDPRPVLAPRRRLGIARPHHAPTRCRRTDQGPAAPPAAPRARAALRPRQPVRERRLPGDARGPRRRVQHEPARQLLGQRRRRELLLDAQDRTRPRRGLDHARRGPRGRRRVRGDLLQHAAAALCPRLRQSGCVRAPTLGEAGGVINATRTQGRRKARNEVSLGSLPLRAARTHMFW